MKENLILEEIIKIEDELKKTEHNKEKLEKRLHELEYKIEKKSNIYYNVLNINKKSL